MTEHGCGSGLYCIAISADMRIQGKFSALA